ncbi:MAG: hypothetical protein BroJett011_07570 [Chloroflexota bacterium]|nr:MAG: hypothetical protein BroJett011_07570 [Chloroflexota bacterium]
MDSLVDGYSKISDNPPAAWVIPKMIEDRIDPQPFLPRLVAMEQILTSNHEWKYLADTLRSKSDLTGGATPLGANYLDKGIRFIRTQDVTPNWIELSDVVFISDQDHQSLKRSALQENDVLLTITGALFGQAAVVRKACLPANISQHSVRMHFKDNLDPHFVSTYLNSSYGQAQIQRQKVGATRSAIDYEGIKKLKILIPTPEIQTYIGDKVRLAEWCREEAQQSWKKAREILEGVLKFKLDASTFETRDKLSVSTGQYIVENFAPAIFRVSPSLVDHQIGVQYFHPRRARAVMLLQKSGLILETLSTVAKRKSNRIAAQTAQDKGIPFIGLASIDQQTGVIDTSVDDDEKISGSSALLKPKDILFSKLRPYLNKVSICPEHFAEAYGSTELLAYETKPKYDPYYIYYIVKCPLTLYQVLDITSGATHPRVDPENVDEVVIPICDDDTQQQIANLTRECLWLLYRAKDLVAEAKSDVEKLIEGKLDTEGIMAGRLKAPTWEGIQANLEERA